MKKFLAIIICLLISFGVCACSGKMKSSPVEDFEYEFDNGTAIITGYIGTDFDIVIPSEIEDRPVVVIDKRAFEGYDLKSVVIPDSVTVIEREAFDSCGLLESVNLPDSITYIGDYAFTDCDKLKEIILSDNLTSIGRAAFYNCDSLESVKFPDSVTETEIDEHAFKDCPNLIKVTMSEELFEKYFLNYDEYGIFEECNSELKVNGDKIYY